MSPRSSELMEEALLRLREAAAALGVSAFSVTVTGAYSAMLYAARAALSERDRYAKTHSGTWNAFHELFVASGDFDAEVAVAWPPSR